MALFLDVALETDVRRAGELGFVWGATVHPLLITGSGGAPLDVVAELCELLAGPVFCPLTAPTLAEREAAALDLVEISPAQVSFALPCTTENLSLLARLTDDGITCGAMAVFGLHQVLVACEAGAHFILPDVARINRLQGGGPQLLGDMRDIIEAVDTGSEILAMGIESPAQAVDVSLAGAHHLALSLELLLSLGEHPLSGPVIEGV